MLDSDDPHLTSLLVADQDAKSPDYELAALHIPILKFDTREPFLPLAVGYSIFRDGGPSASFPRTINPGPDEVAIEYTIWWDWDMGHLYDLEHVWVYLDSNGSPVRAEASWHGRYDSMGVNGSLPPSGDRLNLFSEPGKHAFAPDPAWYRAREEKNRWICCRGAGTEGVLVTDLFTDQINTKSFETDKVVQSFLRRHAFVPTYEFNRTLRITSERLVPWPKLFQWIPERVSYLAEGLQELVKLDPAPFEPLECERVP